MAFWIRTFLSRPPDPGISRGGPAGPQNPVPARWPAPHALAPTHHPVSSLSAPDQRRTLRSSERHHLPQSSLTPVTGRAGGARHRVRQVTHYGRARRERRHGRRDRRDRRDRAVTTVITVTTVTTAAAVATGRAAVTTVTTTSHDATTVTSVIAVTAVTVAVATVAQSTPAHQQRSRQSADRDPQGHDPSIPKCSMASWPRCLARWAM